MMRVEKMKNGWSRPLKLLLAAAFLWGLAGCPGSLEDPDRFTQNPDSGDTGNDQDANVDTGGDTTPGVCNPMTIQQELFVPTCGNNDFCHGDASVGNLNLTEPDVESRTINVMSPNCMDKTLVVPGDPANSYILEKVMDAPTCGTKMPLGIDLTQEQIDCIVDWISAQ